MHENGENDRFAAVRRNDENANRRSVGCVSQAHVHRETSRSTHVRRDGLGALRLPAAGQTLHVADHDKDQ